MTSSERELNRLDDGKHAREASMFWYGTAMHFVIIAALLGATPTPNARILIIAGVKTQAAAESALAKLKVKSEGLAPGYPRIVKSDDYPGLKKGVWVAVLSACALNNVAGTVALYEARTKTKGGSTRTVTWPEPEKACAAPALRPEQLWLDSPSGKIYAPTGASKYASEGVLVVESAGVVTVLEPGEEFVPPGYSRGACGVGSRDHERTHEVKGAELAVEWECSKDGCAGDQDPDTVALIQHVTIEAGKPKVTWQTFEEQHGACH